MLAWQPRGGSGLGGARAAQRSLLSRLLPDGSVGSGWARAAEPGQLPSVGLAPGQRVLLVATAADTGGPLDSPPPVSAHRDRRGTHTLVAARALLQSYAADGNPSPILEHLDVLRSDAGLLVNILHGLAFRAFETHGSA